jgi:hypothetical protein
MATLWTVVTLLAGLQAPEHALLDLPAMVQRAPIIVLARVADPRMDVQNVAGQRAPFQRMRRHLELVSVLRGPLRGQKKLPQHLRVDDSHWQNQNRGALTRYHGQLSREPNPGQTVLAFLRTNGHGEFELAADFALDRGERAAEVQALLQAKSGR